MFSLTFYSGCAGSSVATTYPSKSKRRTKKRTQSEMLQLAQDTLDEINADIKRLEDGLDNIKQLLHQPTLTIIQRNNLIEEASNLTATLKLDLYALQQMESAIPEKFKQEMSNRLVRSRP